MLLSTLGDFAGGIAVRNLPVKAGDAGSIPGSQRSPGEEYATILASEIPWTEEPGGLQSTGLQRVGHDRAQGSCQL